MKKTVFMVLVLLICLFSSCTAEKGGDLTQQSSDTSDTSRYTNGDITSESSAAPSDENPNDADANNVKELSREGDYKLMELYMYYDNQSPSDNHIEQTGKMITFELPVEWHTDSSSVFGLSKGEELYPYALKVDMWWLRSAIRDDVLKEYNDEKRGITLFDEGIYSTGNYEIFYYKYKSAEENTADIACYYLYKNGECFFITTYDFESDMPEADAVFKRIVESIRF